ncbi:glycosyltransferase family 8 protein [uncultured Limosilactobacillus sp.]|uniref:glycosyltransferase family 8 protein n=1 Tax=uncultured Limosilactobacillus sp. TaxID=2837629 RepID=UPI0025DF1595|nr:glycosyltransferase family 8 protein [uncultured Limosilactobacillus sp.]
MSLINIAMVADWQYKMPLETTIKSIFYHNQHVNLYIINPDIPQEWFRTLNHFADQLHSHLIDCKYDPATLKSQTISLDHVDSTSSARLLIPDLVKADRVLYLDADLIVCQDLTTLYQTELEDHAVAAVTDWGQPSDFNAGVMLLNLKKIRETANITQQMLDFGAQPNLPTGDQSVYNHFFGGDRYLRLPAEDNLQMGQEQKIANWIANGVPNADHLMAEIQDHLKSMPDAVIVHYLGAAKPWNIISVCRHRDLWWQYHDLDWNEVSHHVTLPVPFNKQQPQLLIYTYTDQLAHLDEFIQHLPNITFNICTPGLFNDHWNKLLQYSNVNLYSVVMDDQLTQLKHDCQAYLDITKVPEEYKGTALLKELLEHGVPVYSFNATQTPSLVDHDHYHVFGDDQVHELETALFSQLVLND